MILINHNTGENFFTLNGKKYPQMYQAVALGASNIGIYGIHDTKNQLLPTTPYGDVKVNGIYHTSQDTLITALIPILYQRGAGSSEGGVNTDWQSQIDLKEDKFTKNTAFNKNFGSGSGQVAEGNDPRFSQGTTAFNWGDHNVVGYLIEETTTQLNQPTLEGNVLTLKFLNEIGVEQSVAIDLSSIATTDTQLSNATYDAAQNIITLTESNGDIYNIDLSEFSVINTTDAQGVTTLTQEGAVKLTVSKVGQSGQWSDILGKPTTLEGYGIIDKYVKLNGDTMTGSLIVGTNGAAVPKVEFDVFGGGNPTFSHAGNLTRFKGGETSTNGSYFDILLAGANYTYLRANILKMEPRVLEMRTTSLLMDPSYGIGHGAFRLDMNGSPSMYVVGSNSNRKTLFSNGVVATPKGQVEIIGSNNASPSLVVTASSAPTVEVFGVRSSTGAVGYDLFSVDYSGNTKANSFIKNGGTSSQFLKADGSVDSTTYLTGLTWDELTGKPTTFTPSAHTHSEYAAANHTHSYDNYQSWNLKTDGVQRTTVQSGGVLDIVGGANTSVSYGAGGVVTISSTSTATNNYLTGVSGSGNGSIIFSRQGLSDLTFDAAHNHAHLYGTTTTNLNSLVDVPGFIRYQNYTSSAVNATPGTINNANGVITMSSHVGGYGKQIGFGDNDDLYMRRTAANSTFGTWRKFYHDGNLPTFDNYGSWSLSTGDGTSTTISSGEQVNFVGSGATSVSRVGNTITISSTDNTGTGGDGNNYLSGASFNTSNRILTLSREGLSDLSVGLSGGFVDGGSFNSSTNILSLTRGGLSPYTIDLSSLAGGSGVVGTTNIAAGIIPTGTSISSPEKSTDGVKDTLNYTTFGNGSQSSTGTESAYVQIDLGYDATVGEHKIWFYDNDGRYYWYNLQYSTDGTNWAHAVGSEGNFVQSNTTSEPEVIILSTAIQARYWRIYANGNTINSANHIYEWEIYEGDVIGGTADGNSYHTGLTWNGTNGELSLSSTNGAPALAVDLDGRYAYASHTHNYDNYGYWKVGINDGNYQNITSTNPFNLVAGTNVTLSRSGSSITINAAGGTGGDGNNYLTGVSGSGNGTVTFTRNGLSDLTWNSSHSHTYTNFGISNTSNTSGHGISLYGGAVSGKPSYGFMFSGTATHGTHGGVTGDWATYMTMDGTNNRGWVFKYATTNVASISGTGVATFGGNVTAPAFYESSLKKYKENIKPFTGNALSLVNQLGIVTFDRKDSDIKDKIGVIADNTPEEFLSTDKDAVDLYKTTFLQAKAIQELTERVEKLEALVQKL